MGPAAGSDWAAVQAAAGVLTHQTARQRPDTALRAERMSTGVPGSSARTARPAEVAVSGRHPAGADVENLDGPGAVNDGVPDSTLPAPSAPATLQGFTQRSPHATWVLR